MDFYYIFEDVETGELFAVIAETDEEALNILYTEDFDIMIMRIYDKFVADDYGDDIIDSYGLDVF